ncbi:MULTISPECIES: MBL fold metallo-hydrolase [unclassified Clostridium]|uniref:MBL fold metallo-hydrolase n=1 Tax=unclassified Clostridium TaxID=2614128 RepID=UPI0002977CC3|nr:MULTISPECIES: MBL fold metallo-hydrolase [unclassified Clostridium]EKQ50555.1 MAG: putative hydrolase (metallo-beta-lactamase superfamily) [Clostridium sp. Maddingley MBC34-26]
MQNNFKKVFLIVPMILFLCISFMGTIAKAEDKVNQSTVVEDNNKDVTNSSSNNLDTKSGVATSPNSSGTNLPKTVSNTGLGNNAAGVSLVEKLPAWENVHGKLYYVTKDGVLKKTGWFKEKDENPNAANENEYYLDKDYSAVTGWKQIDKLWYYFDEAGVKQTGWKYINYNWYHLDKDGIMQTGWFKENGYKYYSNDEGIMSVGKKYIGNNWYFFGSSGILQTGFYFNEGRLYYSDESGIMIADQWVKTKNNKYYVKADSSLATGYAIIDNEAENFDSSGKYIGPAEMKDYLFIKHLNVGRADCAFIKLPNGETALIDTGTPETSRQVVNFLKNQKLKEEDGKGIIDYIVITHGHSDHIGGLASILENFKVKKVYMPDNAKMKDWYSYITVTKENAADVQMMKKDYEVYNDAAKAMKESNMEFTNTKKDDFIDKDKILQFVESDKNFGPIGSSKAAGDYWGINENSAIVYLNYGDLQELFTADMEWNSEKDFWQNDLLKGRKVDVLKVPHHGFDTSSTSDFINYLKPAIGVISRAKEDIEKGSAYNNLISNGVSIYETSEKDGVSIYATQENWTLGK